MSTKERQTETLKRLRPFCDELSERHGYTEVKVGFECTPELTATWRRYFTEDGMGFEMVLPDYLDDAPSNVLSDMVEAAMVFVVSKRRPELPGSVEGFILDPSFAYKRQETYLRRSVRYTDEDDGLICESLDALTEKGLVSDVGNVAIRWLTNDMAIMPEIHKSMRVVGLPKALESCEGFQNEVCEYMIWYSMARIRYPDAGKNDPRVQALLNSYPSRSRVDKVLVDSNLKI